MLSEELTDVGFVYGESARAHGRNVQARLRALEVLYPFPMGLAADLGCGQGAYTIELAKRFDRVIGIDILARNIDHARRNVPGNVQLFCAALERTPLEVGSVDA